MTAVLASFRPGGDTGLHWRRIKGVMLQNAFIMRHSPLRLMELLYWPLIELFLWGFITRFLAQAKTQVAGGVSIILGAVVLWDVLFRSQQELAMTYMVDVWDRNVINLNASPLRQTEYFLGGLMFACIRVVVGSTVLVIITWLAFGFDVLRAGAGLIPALLVLLGYGWSLGLLIRAALMRFGSNAEVLAWSLALLIQPVAAVFYPISSLPGWLQPITYAIPAAQAFEALRALFAPAHQILIGRLAIGAAVDVLYLVIAATVANLAFRAVRRKGLLSRPGY